jgi:phosphate transport system protein
MRTEFHERLAALSDQIAQLCGLAGVTMERATRALLETDLGLAEQAFDDHQQIVEKCSKVEREAFTLIALQQPVAGDLRSIVCSLKCVAEIDRMATLALHVAKVARMRHPDSALPDDVKDCFSEMGRLAVEIAESARQVLAQADPDKAARLREEDDAMDELHRHLFEVLSDPRWKDGVSSAIDVALLGRYYERFADHAVEIGRRVVFEATGGLPPEKYLSLN